jgi:DNA polymerase
MPILFRDFETRSTLDLKDVGAWRYAADPTTDVWCVGYAVDDGEVKIWTPGQEIPEEFHAAARDPDWLVVAHNDQFERAIEEKILTPRYGVPAIPITRRRCSMAMAHAGALPGKLEKVILALSLPYPKDKAGGALMRRMAKPLPDGGWLEDAVSLERLYQYCRRDVEAERAVYQTLPPLTEQRLWELDAVINDRGFHVDTELLEAAHRVVTEATEKLQAEFRELTGLESTNQTAKFSAWLAAHDCIVDDIQKGTLGHALRRKEIGANVRRAIELRIELAHASAAKIEALLAWRGADNRVRGSLVFHGASTGRWVGRGPQPQNFKRDSDGIDVKITGILNGGAELASPIEAVGDAARAMICAAPGHRLLIADFSGIESRVLAWLSGQISKLKEWAKYDSSGALTDDPYYILGRACGLAENIARDKGKIIDLAFGFAGSVGAWKTLAPDDDSTPEETIKRYRDQWRARHPYTVAFWKAIDHSAIRAVRERGTEFIYRRLRLLCDERFLRITLPSGRALSYPFPRIETGKYDTPVVIFKDASAGKWSDCRFGQGSYGGLWTENITQAVARDVLAGAIMRLEAAGYQIVLTVHDEIVAEAPIGFGSVEEFRQIVTAVPEWAEGLPIAAKVRNGERFSKAPAPADHNEHQDDATLNKQNRAPARANESDEADCDPDCLDDGEAGDETYTASPPDRGDLLATVFDLREEIQNLSLAPPHDDSEDGRNGNGAGNTEDNSNNGCDKNAGDYPHGEQRSGRQVATYLYRDHLGRNHTRIVKMAATRTRRTQYPQSFWADGRWLTKKPAGWLKVPYRLPELLTAIADKQCVFIPEGEKDCETLVKLGLVATTSSEGATPLKAQVSNWTPELNKWFAGVRCAYVLEDNDTPGQKFAREKLHALRSIVSDIRIVSFPDVPIGEDVSYWIEELGHSKEELLAHCKAASPHGDAELESVRADQVVMRAVHWLWGKRFAVGKIGIIAGLPDEGKGQILCYVAARCTRGLEWPNGEGISPQGNVIILSAEEHPGDSLAPRLEAAGADLSRIHFINMVRDHDEKTGQERRRMFSLISDLEKLRRKIVEVGDVVAILIDPISAYLGIGAIDSYRDTDVRAVLGPLKDLAEEMRIAIITVMHFNKKVDITNALLRVSNSMAFVGLPRHAYGVIADAENARKLFVRAKNNDAAESDNQTLAFHFDVKEVGADPDSGEPIRAPFIVWEPGYVDVTASEAMQAASEHKSPGDRDKAKNLLLALLGDGREVFVDELKDTAEGHGISWRTVRRAGDDLKVVVAKERAAKGKWFWKLPQKED